MCFPVIQDKVEWQKNALAVMHTAIDCFWEICWGYCRAPFVHWYMAFWAEEMPNAFCREVLLSVCQILCTTWAIPATNSPLSISNQDALQKPSCYMLLPKASTGFEVQLTVLPPSLKIGNKGGARGEVSRQWSGQGSRWCPGYPPGLPFSAQWESSSIVVVFSAASWDPSLNHWVSHNPARV